MALWGGRGRDQAPPQGNRAEGVPSIGESYFFRDCGQFALLRERILPELLALCDKRPLRIWSAGCARGEEPYSLAILLRELRPPPAACPALILGTDNNPACIQQAEKGLFTGWSLRGVTPEQRARWFSPLTPRDGIIRWALDPAIRAMVRFRLSDLLRESPPEAKSPFDLVLCRNVFIYFTPDQTAAALQRLIAGLRPGGWLLTAHGELLGQPLEGLEALSFPQSLIYRRQPATVSRVAPAAPPKRRTVAAPRPRKPASAPPPAAAPAPPPSPLRRAESLYRQHHYRAAAREAERALERPEERFAAHTLAARAWANLGAFDEAAHHAERSERLNRFDPEPWYLRALLAAEQGRSQQARKMLDKALYLDPDHLPSLIELLSVLLRDGEAARADRLRQTLLERLAALPDEALVDPREGATAAVLRERLGGDDGG